MADWRLEEIERMDKEAESRTGEFVSASKLCPVGRTVIVVMNKKPETVKGDFGASAIFEVTKEGETQAMSVKKTSPLYRDIVDKLYENKDADSVEMAIIRTGDGKKTRYSVE